MSDPRTEYGDFLRAIPDHWSKVKMREVGRIVSGGTPSRDAPSLWGGGIPWVTPGELTALPTKEIDKTKETISSAGLAGSGANLLPVDSLLITSRATLGARAINTVPMATNQGFKSVVPFDRRLTGYLFHLTEKIKPEMVRRASGTTFLEISGSEFGDIVVPLPRVIEASKIAEILDTLDATIRGTDAVVSKLRAMKQGLLHDLLTRGVDANGDLRPPQCEAPLLYKETPVGWLPRAWDVVTMGDAAESLVDGPFGSNLKTEHYVPGPGVRVVRLQNIQDGYFDDTEKAFIRDSHAAKLTRNQVVSGDLLIASLGDDGHPVGRACLYPQDIEPGINKADCFRFRGKASCRNGYTMLFLNGHSARRQARGFEQGVTMKRMNLGNLRRIKMALPALSEQIAIEERATAIEETYSATLHELEKLRHQKSGLMEDLLTGRISVAPLL
jgi:type I restriction enzyme S subunit